MYMDHAVLHMRCCDTFQPFSLIGGMMLIDDLLENTIKPTTMIFGLSQLPACLSCNLPHMTALLFGSTSHGIRQIRLCWAQNDLSWNASPTNPVFIQQTTEQFGRFVFEKRYHALKTTGLINYVQSSGFLVWLPTVQMFHIQANLFVELAHPISVRRQRSLRQHENLRARLKARSEA